ncbi:MAG: hypothetical protein KQ78_00463 [Candidatus Izimaplasma bacterium HR2]|nr:MAG: hypothetical protein KQ78_00463 [Candidatus Izimaplasma bacterium HR2]
MRLQQYINNELNEELVIDDWTEMINIIKKDCSKFLKEFGSTPIYRGTKEIKNDNTLIRMKSRINRTPVDTPQHLHDLMDELFKKHYGWKARSESIFVIKDSSTAESYGNITLFFPIGNYKYLWSKEVDDLYEQIRIKIINKIIGYGIYTRDLEPKDITSEFETKLEDIIKTYKTIGFKNSKKQECMFKVNNYYLIRFDNLSKSLPFMDEVSN